MPCSTQGEIRVANGNEWKGHLQMAAALEARAATAAQETPVFEIQQKNRYSVLSEDERARREAGLQ